MSDDPSLEQRVAVALRQAPEDGTAGAAAPGGPDVMVPVSLLAELYDRYRAQQRLLDRLTHISDQFQRAERDRGLSYVERYLRKVRQVEKIIRISDHYSSMMRDLNERLHRLSTHDDLTGLPNRRFMRDRLAQEAALSNRTGSPFSIALADVDRFKTVNDTWGHSVGDAVLARTATTVQASLRPYDICARWGGEEFLMMFPGCDADAALGLAERIRTAVGTDGGSSEPTITLSLGVTPYQPGEHLDHTLRRADTALYRAKDHGRNRTELG